MQHVNMATNGKSNCDLYSKLVTVFPLKHVDKCVRACECACVRMCVGVCATFFFINPVENIEEKECA